MKKIGILHGMESSFPQAFVEKVNSLKIKDIHAEIAHIDVVSQSEPTDYAVLIDRISQDVPFYRAYLKNAALTGTAVINNPFWWSADEKFFNNCLAVSLGVPVPKTILLPSFERPADTSDQSFRNLAYPLSWEKIFNHIGFPAYMKPHSGGGWKSVYKVENEQALFDAYHETGQLVMMLQEEIVFEDYYRCYCIGGKAVRIMQYEPRNPHHLRYVTGKQAADKKLLATIEAYVLKLNHALGYDFNTVEFAVRNGIPYAIDFCNPAPDADVNSVGEENFEWVVNAAAELAVERAKAQKAGQDNLTWGTYIKNAANGGVAPAPKAEAKPKAAPKPKAAVEKVEKPTEKKETKAKKAQAKA